MQKSTLDEIHALIDRYFASNDMNVLLKEFVQEKVQEQSIWSEITLNTYYMFGGNSPDIHRVAACTELILLALDIIDDLQDQDNDEKCWSRYPGNQVLNAAVALMVAVSGDIMRQEKHYPNLSCSKVNDVILRAFDGQHADLLNRMDSEAEYIDMIQKKSGSLVQLVCYMGYSCLEDCDQQSIEKLNEVAGYVGIMAQLENDLRDLLRFDGKSDLRKKKKTLPIMYLLSHEHPFSVIKEYYSGNVAQHAFLQSKQACIEYIQDSGCVEYSKIIQKLFLQQAEQSFQGITALFPWKEELDKLFFLPYRG